MTQNHYCNMWSRAGRKRESWESILMARLFLSSLMIRSTRWKRYLFLPHIFPFTSPQTVCCSHTACLEDFQLLSWYKLCLFIIFVLLNLRLKRSEKWWTMTWASSKWRLKSHHRPKPSSSFQMIRKSQAALLPSTSKRSAEHTGV